jgi:1-aminocyclopropane-1-carboxylate deaminase
MQLEPRKITTELIHLPVENGIHVFVLRLDKIHPVISGNKWFKLKYYLEDALKQEKKTIVTFGGAWSNHIVATAAACHMQGIASVGIIRGEEPAEYSATLKQAKEYGMEFHFLSRRDYADKKIPQSLDIAGCYLVAEGGYGAKGAKGAGEILEFNKQAFTHCCCAVGTGTMMAGLIQKLSPEQKLVGISVLKNHSGLDHAVRSLTGPAKQNWQIIHDYAFGGYAKDDRTLIQFMNDFYKRTGVPSDFVYTAKLFFAVEDLIKNKFFPGGSTLLLVHSGGLQGNQSLTKGTLIY